MNFGFVLITVLSVDTDLTMCASTLLLQESGTMYENIPPK